MFFYITGYHSYDTCYTHDTEKHGVKIHFNLVNRLSHTTNLLVEANTFEALDA